MRVQFLRDYNQKGEQSYLKGAVVELDQGLAEQLLESNTVKALPRTVAELAEDATKYHPGDEERTPKERAARALDAIALTGDTRADVEAQLGENDPHVVREEVTEKAEKEIVKDEKKPDDKKAPKP